MNEKIKRFLSGFGTILRQFLLILFGLLAGLWVVTDLIFTWAMSRA
ncbi:MAG: hypothetical protein HFF49_00740 [Lawsonibacter sp.]|nr:hypothetical protein [Lawsonibacter sp.]